MMELSISNLSKTYANGVVALDRVSLDIPTGLFGLLGPNGAGKSTLMRTIATLQEADSGEITFQGMDVLRQKREVKRVLGYLPQTFGFYPRDTGYDLLDHFTLLRGVKNRKQRKTKVEELLRRVNLCPKLIIVDEPTAGLDPEERVRFHNLLSEIGENIVVILSTHIVDDVSDLCTNMAIIDKGKIILKGSTLDAMSRLEGKIWEKEILKDELPKYEERYDVISTRLFAGKTFIHVYSESNPENGFSTIVPSLEDVYFYHLSRET